MKEHMEYNGKNVGGQMENNTLTELNNILFDEMHRLNDKNLNKEALKEEIERARALSSVAERVIGTGDLILKAQSLVAEHHSSKIVEVPGYLLCEGQYEKIPK